MLVVWNTYYGDVVRACLRTRPIAEGEFLSQCRALADACGVPQPRFERIDLGGGVIANAVALPSLAHVFGALHRYAAGQIRPAGAPGHLRARARAFRALQPWLPPPVESRHLFAHRAWRGLHARRPNHRPRFGTCCPPFSGSPRSSCPLAMRARGRQRQETACDLRAVELTGDADALVRGLTKLYTVARMPRRTEQQAERSATHPSLARRIRDIRKAAGVAPVTLGGGAQLHERRRPHRRHLRRRGAALGGARRRDAQHQLRQSDRAASRCQGAPRFPPRRARRGARRWEMSLADSDVARLQAVLDVVDGRLADPPRAAASFTRAFRGSSS